MDNKFTVVTFGCWLNKADSDLVITKLKLLGWEYVEDIDSADTIVINTCAVREEAERNELKLLAELSKKYPSKRIIVTGCLTRVRPAAIRESSPNAVIVTSHGVESIDEIVGGGDNVYVYDDRPMKYLPNYYPELHGHRYVVPIQVGCLGNCSFCVTKIGRMGFGKVRSYDKHDLINAIKRAVNSGAREVYLTGQEISAYGRDKGYDLVDLLEELLREIDGRFMVRLGMMEPLELSRILDGLLDIVKSDWRVYRFFHIPVQSGSDRILTLMKRKYSASFFRDIVTRIRRVFPDATIVTDVIVGFPGETDDDFWASVRLIEELGIDKVNLARYSRRPFTEAAYMEQVPEQVKKERSKVATEIFSKVSLERNKPFIGREMWGIASEVDFRGENYIVRSYNYKPIAVKRVDIGAFVKARIIDATPHRLIGELLASEELGIRYRVDFRISEGLDLMS
ncbi:tRNA (N(6)-L-threonylcarbamoyladenosine(37)-C(2))-methylthiotransferase [Vulcanisaeta souniana]|uniref:tRNA-t(6)A37 methylthiotransferase n=1 Tax=Vulcanisaeta souniana JCM 11219 TaxID=1293586 RepID=A0A830E146_9CREN|nr:tRNA (N(6)-L-threonylcarbamoyladenosine(37)-C(2))-methylthiotransferase [Vulcanisaeta souniana]BDR91327.1 RNA modification protein [Vulcanisaeta souniana JCM 11219]GGI72369.1 RNA modification protein [Vulcanisaeta souniana JCM 11219]